MWVPLIEKAYAKLHGCYENLISGYVDEGIQELTGMQPEKIFIRDEKTGVFPHKMIKLNYGGADGFWDFLTQRDLDGCLLGCSIKGDKGGPQIIEGKPSGLIINHAYGINDIFELKDPWDLKKVIRLLRLRNPWGSSEWLGAWSGDSTEMKKYGEVIKATYISKLPPDEQFALDADDGTFLMHYDDWKDNFSTLFLNIDFPEDWTGVRFKSKWTKSNSAGLPTSYEKEPLEKFAKNPQFYIKPAYDAEVMISLTQIGGRLPVDGQYSDYPFSEQLNYAAVSIFELNPGQTTLDKFDKNRLVFMSPIKRERENSGRCVLKAGKDKAYVVVCAPEIEGKKGDFYLSVYFNQ